MADEWWTTSALSTGSGGGGGDSSPSSAATTRQVSSISFQTPASGSGLTPGPDVDGAAASSPYSSFLDDLGTADASFDALLRLQGDASHRLLLINQGGAAPHVVPPPAFPDAAYGTVASRGQGGGGAALYAADRQYGSSFCGSYAGVPTAASTTTKPSSGQLLLKSSPSGGRSPALQQFPGFFIPPGLGATAAGSPPRVLMQALEPRALKTKTEPADQVDACSSSSATRRSGGIPDPPATVKKHRIQTPSPLPLPLAAFKARKEKLGDRITALQQLVSPFGKTDTASVLQEAIEHIKFLHHQVASLTSPYLSCGRRRPVQLRRHQVQNHHLKPHCATLRSDGGGGGGETKEEDLRSRGLCLVPVASTYTAATATATEVFGGTFR